MFPIQKGIPFDILSWWLNNAPVYPMLVGIAKDVHEILFSTVASETTFSMGGRVLDEYRCSLTPKMMEKLICGQYWLRCQKKDQGNHVNIFVIFSFDINIALFFSFYL